MSNPMWNHWRLWAKFILYRLIGMMLIERILIACTLAGENMLSIEYIKCLFRVIIQVPALLIRRNMVCLTRFWVWWLATLGSLSLMTGYPGESESDDWPPGDSSEYDLQTTLSILMSLIWLTTQGTVTFTYQDIVFHMCTFTSFDSDLCIFDHMQTAHVNVKYPISASICQSFTLSFTLS